MRPVNLEPQINMTVPSGALVYSTCGGQGGLQVDGTITTPFHVGNAELVGGYSLRVGTRCDVDCLLKLLIVPNGCNRGILVNKITNHFELLKFVVNFD